MKRRLIIGTAVIAFALAWWHFFVDWYPTNQDPDQRDIATSDG